MTIWHPVDDPHSDLTSHDTFSSGVPHNTFARLRNEDPIHWTNYKEGKGFWSITRHHDIAKMIGNTKAFTSEQGIRMEDQTHEEYLARRTFQEIDGTGHRNSRMKVAKAFSGPVIIEFEEKIRNLCSEILDNTLPMIDFDATKHIARELPMRMLGRILGLPEEDLPWLVEKGDALIANTDPDFTDHVLDKLNTNEMPIVIYQGFSIHGNEPSGANAGIIAAYHLAASNSKETKELLRNTIILFDPCYNPDGLQRFSQWANSNKNILLNPDTQDREYNENWPKGRTNHYWFDLNRDWLPAQLPESKARIRTFTEWLPNILTDHHEMGTNSTFFFQPGIPSRVNPLTPGTNQKLTKKIGAYHEDALNKIGSLYYSEEDYDDFYYGKGSTYPDVNGSIGILFEPVSYTHLTLPTKA